MRLFEIAGQYRSLQALEDSEDLPEEVIRDTLESLEGDFEVKAVQVAKFVLSLKSSADAIKEAAKAMQLRSERLQKRADAIKHYLLLQMQLCDFKKLQTAEITIRRQNSPPSVVIGEGASVPPEYWTQPPPPPACPDKKLLKQALQNGVEIPGVYVEAGEHVRIEI